MELAMIHKCLRCELAAFLLVLLLQPGFGDAVAGMIRDKRWEVHCPIDGCMGQKGARGSPGPMGIQGIAGVMGPPGFCDPNFCFRYIQDNLPPPIQRDPVPGEKGALGEQGEPGEDGEPGLPGNPGPPGEKGMQGPPGNDGSPGEQGEAGSKGIPGPPGPIGPQGPAGSPGEGGRKGFPGQPGPPGEDGESGTPGQDGAVGPPGENGTPGRTGLPGKDGKPGAPGAPGPPGNDGSRGPPGPPIDVIPLSESEPCSVALQGVIRFDPDLMKLYFCDGSTWTCLQSTNCGGGTCPSPFGPQEIGSQWYQVFVTNVTQDTQDAVDIVLVVDESGSMINEHQWLLIMVPLLEQVLTSAGVGDGDVRNRYCLVGFGSFGDLRQGHFRPVDGMPCYSASDFPRAQAQLVTDGAFEDGYEAIQFSLDNIPFRTSPFIAKNILLITDEGRAIIPEGENITRQSIEQNLRSQNTLLNAIVMADYVLSDNENATVMGVDGDKTAYILESNSFSTSTSNFTVVEAETNTKETYVDLALSLGGAAWSIQILRNSSLTANQEIQNAFTSALAQIKLNEIRASIESCRRCTCISDGGSVRTDCITAPDEQFCQCVVNNAGDTTQCVRTPAPV